MSNIDRRFAEQALQRAQNTSRLALDPGNFGGGYAGKTGLFAQLGAGIAGAYARNKAEKKIAEQERIANQAFSTRFPQFQDLAGQLSPDTRDALIAQQLQGQQQLALQKQQMQQMPKEELLPVSPQGKLLRDVKAGLVPEQVAQQSLKTDTPEPITLTDDILKIPNLKERAQAIQSIADQNIAQGNTKIGSLYTARARNTLRQYQQEQDKIDKATSTLSKRLDKTGIVELADALENITDIINSNEDIPGVGKGALIPKRFLSDEGKQLSQSLATLKNSILKARSGGAVTPQESKRLLEEIGVGVTKTDDQLRIGVQNVINLFNDKLNNIKGSVPSEAVQRLAERSGGDIFKTIGSLQVTGVGGGASSELDDILSKRGI